MFGRRKDDASEFKESRLGRSFWATAGLCAGAAAYVVWALVQIKRGNAEVAVGFVASVFLCAPIFALFLINIPKFVKEASAARAKPLRGVAHDGFEILIMERGGLAYANASQAARAIGEDPKHWPLGFARMGPGSLLALDGELWARRDAWSWRCARQPDLSLSRVAKRLEREGFGAIDRRRDAQARAKVEQDILAMNDPARIKELSEDLNRREAAAKRAAEAEDPSSDGEG